MFHRQVQAGYGEVLRGSMYSNLPCNVTLEISGSIRCASNDIFKELKLLLTSLFVLHCEIQNIT